MIRTVLLDIDDTILDFTGGERKALETSFAQHGLPYQTTYVDYYHAINVGWWARYDKGEVGIDRVIVERFVDLFSRIGVPMPLDFGRSYEANLAAQHDFIRGAKGFVERLKTTYAVYAVSNGRNNVQLRRLAESGLDKMVDGVFTSETVGYHKPEKEFFDYVAQHIEGFCPQQTVLVGDSLTSDIIGGIAYGLKTVWFNRTHRAPSPTLQPDAILDDYREIEAFIRSL